MNDQGAQELKAGHWDLGGEAVTAGPYRRHRNDRKHGMESTRPLLFKFEWRFRRLGRGWSKLRTDKDTIHNIYGADASFEEILNGEMPPHASAQQFLAALEQAGGK